MHLPNHMISLTQIQSQTMFQTLPINNQQLYIKISPSASTSYLDFLNNAISSLSAVAGKHLQKTECRKLMHYNKTKDISGNDSIQINRDMAIGSLLEQKWVFMVEGAQSLRTLSTSQQETSTTTLSMQIDQMHQQSSLEQLKYLAQ